LTGLPVVFIANSHQVFSESSKWAAEAIGAFRCVSSLTLENVIIERYQKLLEGHVTSAYRKARWTTLVFALSDSSALACQALIFWYGGRLLASGEYQVLNFFVCFMAVTQGAEQAGVGFSFGPNAAQANAAANRILSIRESRGERSSLTDDVDSSNEDRGIIPDIENGIKIELKDVGFRYPTRQVQVFKHLNITVERGQFAALVGSSGAGKSSTVALLERFYDAQEGSILCNGRDIRSVDVHEYRKLISLVAQEASLFQGVFPLLLLNQNI
jgi:ATP-binding cassette, subfamily B (MDR/TAP), member 1